MPTVRVHCRPFHGFSLKIHKYAIYMVPGQLPFLPGTVRHRRTPSAGNQSIKLHLSVSALSTALTAHYGA